MQKLYKNNSGNKYITAQIKLSDDNNDIRTRIGFSMVEDSKSGNLILKLVKLLPATVDATIDLSNFSFANKEAALSVLTGNPKDSERKPVESEIQISDNFSYQLPGYSFSVIRVKTK